METTFPRVSFRSTIYRQLLRESLAHLPLSLMHTKENAATNVAAFFGAPSGTRTQDPLIKSQLLYQLS